MEFDVGLKPRLIRDHLEAELALYGRAWRGPPPAALAAAAAHPVGVGAPLLDGLGRGAATAAGDAPADACCVKGSQDKKEASDSAKQKKANLLKSKDSFAKILCVFIFYFV